MGQSTDGILFYGYVWKDQCYEFYSNGDDVEETEWEKLLLESRGATDLSYTAQSALRESEPCKVASHCSCEYPIPYVCIKRTETCAYRGSPKRIEPETMTITAEEQQRLEDFITELGINTEEAEGPGWFLVSEWC